MPAGPLAGPCTDLIVRLLSETSKTQQRIAGEVGYDRPNVITMFKQRMTRVPLPKVPALADALGWDRCDLMRRWFEEFEPDALACIEHCFGPILSPQERALVEEMRRRATGL